VEVRRGKGKEKGKACRGGKEKGVIGGDFINSTLHPRREMGGGKELRGKRKYSSMRGKKKD